MDAKLPTNTIGTMQSQGHQEVVDEHSVPRARENIAKPRFEVEEEEYGGVIDSSFFDNNNGSDEFHDYAGKTLILILHIVSFLEGRL